MAKSKKKISRSSHEAQLAIARRNPAFRKAEAFERLKADVAIAYLAVAADIEGDMNVFVEAYANKLDKLGGIESLNTFLEDMELLVWDYDDYFDEHGRITQESIHVNGQEFLTMNAADIALL